MGMNGVDVKEYKPIPTVSLEGEDVIPGISVDDVVTMTITARLVEESSRDYEGEPRKCQRFQISKVSKSGSEKERFAKKAQSYGKGAKG